MDKKLFALLSGCLLSGIADNYYKKWIRNYLLY